MKWGEAPAAFRIYLFALLAALGAVLIPRVHELEALEQPGAWLILTVLLALSEFLALSIHTRKGRYNLSSSEAVLMPMFVALAFPQVVISALIANAVARPSRWRLTPVQELFNVAQYGCAAVVGSSVWSVLAIVSEGLTVRNAAAASAATMAFALSSHVFVAAGIALARKGRFKDLTLDVGTVFLMNLVGELIFGLLLTASYYAADWMVAFFFLPLAALLIGYRAIVSQTRERERVEHLHSASRALASTPDLEDGVLGFLRSATDIVSSEKACAVFPGQGELACSSVDKTSVLHSLSSVPPQAMRVLHHLQTSHDSVIVGEDDASKHRSLAVELGARSMLAVPLWDGTRVVGALMAMDRVGPENFGDSDARILEAIGSELMVRLESFRWFSEVAEERERFGRIFTGSKEGICLIDAGGVLRAWNPALERITGHRAEDVMGRVWSDVVVIRDRSENRLRADELTRVGPDEELEIVTRSGPSRWITVTSGPVGEEESSGWVVLIRDVTAEHEVEAAKSDFLSTISHELRTPLTTIKGSLQVLSRGRDNLPPELSDQMIGVTTRGAERLERLVMNLLAVSQIESGTMPVFPDEVSMESLLEDRVAVMLKDHDRKVLTLPEKPLVVRADRERLSHALEHLLENALKFGGPSGEVVVELSQANGYARVAVTDEGPGIPVADRERIFERFVRLGDVLTRETQGAGVGLFIAARSIQAMGGDIGVQSTESRGSTFYLTVPLAHPVAVEDTA